MPALPAPINRTLETASLALDVKARLAARGITGQGAVRFALRAALDQIEVLDAIDHWREATADRYAVPTALHPHTAP